MATNADPIIGVPVNTTLSLVHNHQKAETNKKHCHKLPIEHYQGGICSKCMMLIPAIGYSLVVSERKQLLLKSRNKQLTRDLLLLA